MESEATRNWPKGQMYFVRHGDTFGQACRCTSALGDYMIAGVWERDPSKWFGIAEVKRWQYGTQHQAIAIADQVHPTADGMGEMQPYRCPAEIAYDLGWS